MEENIQLTAEVFIDTGKDFRPEDSLTVPYACIPGEPVTLEFDLSVFEHTCGFRFDPLLEDSNMVRLDEIALTYEDGETKVIDFSRIKTNSDVDFEPIFVYLHKDPKFFVDEALCLKLTRAKVSFRILELGLAEKEYWQEIKKHSVSEKEKEQARDAFLRLKGTDMERLLRANILGSSQKIKRYMDLYIGQNGGRPLTQKTKETILDIFDIEEYV